MPATGSEYPNGDVQKGKWLNTTGGTTGNYWELIDEAISSANDADYVRGAGSSSDNATESLILDMTNMPSDFKSITDISYNIRYRQFSRVDDTISFNIWLERADGTDLTNVVSINNVTTTAFTNSGVTAFTLTTAGTNGTKTDWDGVRLVIQQVYSASMAADGGYIAISAVEITGNYTAFSTLSRTASSSGTGSSTASGVITKLRTATSSGTGSSVALDVVTNIRTASAGGTGSSNASGVISKLRTASASGTSSSSTSILVTRIRTASSSGTGSSVAIFAQTIDRTASASAVGSSVAIGAKTFFATAISSGLGSSVATGLHISIRTVTATGVGSSVVVSGRAISREASSSGQGSSPNVLWVNAGRTLSEGIKLPPFWIDAKPKFVRRRN